MVSFVVCAITIKAVDSQQNIRSLYGRTKRIM